MTELNEGFARHVRFADGSAQWFSGALPAIACNAQPLPKGGVECMAVVPASMVTDWTRRSGVFPVARMNPLVPLAKRFIARAVAQGMKGKARDRAALEFFIGAIYGLRFAGAIEDANHVERCAVLILATRGYSEVQHWAGLPEYLGTSKTEG